MKKIILLITAFSFLISCTSTNPYNLSEDEGAYLKNRKELKGKAKYIYIFNNVVTSEGRKSLDPGLVAEETVEKRILKIPSGEMTLGLKINYYPEAGADPTIGEALSLGFKYMYSSDARSRVSDIKDYYEILVINPKGKVSGLEGIKLNALEGRTYQINCKIESGKAYIWIEDDSGEKVSETVRGIGASYPNYWLWEYLPDPVN